MIISSLNYTWFLLMALAVCYIVLVTRHFKNKTEEEKLNFMSKQALCLCIIWILYKVALGLDKEYAPLFFFWKELPLQPCNTIIWLSLIAAKKNNKVIMEYAFFCGVLFATLAMLMPSPGFYDISFFKLRALGYWITHLFAVITGILYVTLGLVDIDYKSSVRAVLFYLVFAFVMHFFNMLLRATVCADATYYYTYGNEDNAVLTMIHNWIPINYVYLIPIAVVGLGAFELETVIIKTAGRLPHKQKGRN